MSRTSSASFKNSKLHFISKFPSTLLSLYVQWSFPYPRIWTKPDREQVFCPLYRIRRKVDINKQEDWRHHGCLCGSSNALQPWASPAVCREPQAPFRGAGRRPFCLVLTTWPGFCFQGNEAEPSGESELFKTGSAHGSLISCNCFWLTGKSLCPFYFCELTEVFTLFAKKEKISLSWHSGKSFCTIFATKGWGIEPFSLSSVEYQYFILNLRYSWWTKSEKKILNEGKKGPPSTVKSKRILSISRTNVGCDLLISPLDKFSLQAKLFSFETAVKQTHTKITQKECFASE